MAAAHVCNIFQPLKHLHPHQKPAVRVENMPMISRFHHHVASETHSCHDVLGHRDVMVRTRVLTRSFYIIYRVCLHYMNYPSEFLIFWCHVQRAPGIYHRKTHKLESMRSPASSSPVFLHAPDSPRILLHMVAAHPNILSYFCQYLCQPKRFLTAAISWTDAPLYLPQLFSLDKPLCMGHTFLQFTES